MRHFASLFRRHSIILALALLAVAASGMAVSGLGNQPYIKPLAPTDADAGWGGAVRFSTPVGTANVSKEQAAELAIRPVLGRKADEFLATKPVYAAELRRFSFRTEDATYAHYPRGEHLVWAVTVAGAPLPSFCPPRREPGATVAKDCANYHEIVAIVDANSGEILDGFIRSKVSD